MQSGSSGLRMYSTIRSTETKVQAKVQNAGGTRGMTTERSAQEAYTMGLRDGIDHEARSALLRTKLWEGVRDPVAFVCVGSGFAIGFALKMVTMSYYANADGMGAAEGSSKSNSQTAVA